MRSLRKDVNYYCVVCENTVKGEEFLDPGHSSRHVIPNKSSTDENGYSILEIDINVNDKKVINNRVTSNLFYNCNKLWISNDTRKDRHAPVRLEELVKRQVQLSKISKRTRINDNGGDALVKSRVDSLHNCKNEHAPNQSQLPNIDEVERLSGKNEDNETRTESGNNIPQPILEEFKTEIKPVTTSEPTSDSIKSLTSTFVFQHENNESGDHIINSCKSSKSPENRKHESAPSGNNEALTVDQQKNGTVELEKFQISTSSTVCKEENNEITLQHSDEMKLYQGNSVFFRCDQCGKTYTSLSHMNDHIRVIHQKEKNFPCPLCGRRFFKQFGLDRHIYSTHTKNNLISESVQRQTIESHPAIDKISMSIENDISKPGFACKMCGHVFKNVYRLRKHQIIHGKREHSCPECGKFFHQKANMILHIKMVHRRERPFLCTYCEGSYSSKQGLDYHISTHFKKDVDVD